MGIIDLVNSFKQYVNKYYDFDIKLVRIIKEKYRDYFFI